MLHEASRSYEAAIKVGGAFQLEEKSTVQEESSQNNMHTFLAPKYTDEGENDNGLDKKEIKAIATVVQVAHANQLYYMSKDCCWMPSRPIERC